MASCGGSGGAQVQLLRHACDQNGDGSTEVTATLKALSSGSLNAQGYVIVFGGKKLKPGFLDVQTVKLHKGQRYRFAQRVTVPAGDAAVDCGIETL